MGSNCAPLVADLFLFCYESDFMMTNIDLIERTFQREGSPYLACNDRNTFFTSENLKHIMHGLVKMYVMR